MTAAVLEQSLKLNVCMYLDVYEQISFKLGMMRDANEL